MTKKTTACQLAMEVPAKMALMAPDDFESHVWTHWNEWQSKWRRVNGVPSRDEMFEVGPGEPIYLVERNGRHYLVTEGTKIMFCNV